MADNVTLPGTGVVISTDDVGSGVEVQRVKVQYGPDGTATDVDTATGLPTTAGYKEVSGSAAANNTDLISTDVSAYRWVSVQLTGTWSATVTWQQSNDNSNWVNVMLGRTDANGDGTTGSTTNNVFSGTLTARYFRMRTTAYTSGTVNATVGFSVHPGWQNAAQLKVSGGGTVTVTGATTPPGDGVSMTSSTVVAGGPAYVYGGNWDRLRSAPNADGQNGTGLLGAGLLVYDGGLYRKALSYGTSGAMGVTPVPGTTGGWTPYSNTALSNTKTQVKSSAGTLGGWFIFNSNTSVAYLQVWDVANASITVGTTAPTYTLPIPAGSAANMEVSCGINHATAINVAATTTATGSTAPTAALNVFLFYK